MSGRNDGEGREYMWDVYVAHTWAYHAIAKSGGGGPALAVVSPRQCILYEQAGVAQPLL